MYVVLIIIKLLKFMNLTRQNIKSLLPFVQESLNKCQFFSIDFEMTGLNSSTTIRNSALDTVFKNY